ncbi:uncharacterized protein LOC113209947 [Frankliniella occidentalis]|uniref:Uncharacterized protein LOC113209947 n=1 Tax=Frankliniella occidentalis TaxID=133901 RepID=A0A9C6U0U3_FRAOC|nr:uncharacterized protein LOC113209947 [Frankliniella occidentalis]
MKGILKHAVCVLCVQPFSVRDLKSGHHGQRIPHILNCGHAACKPCLQKVMTDKKSKSIICEVCSTPSPLYEAGDALDLSSIFPLHLYLVGQFLTRNAEKREDEPSFSLPTRKKASSSKNNRVICNECDVTTANCFCRECTIPFCESCFTKIHQGKTLKKHVKEDLRLVHVKTIMCPKHPRNDLDMLCETCNTPVCMKCSILSHKDHSVVSTCEKNEEKLPEVKADLERANLQRARMKETLRELGAGQGSTKAADVLQETERALALHMVHVHGRLQLRERELLAQLEKKRFENASLFRTMESQLSSSLSDLEDAMRMAHAACLPDNLATSNLTEVHSRLCQAMTVPVHLLKGKIGVELILNQELFDEIDLIKLKLNDDVGYMLVKEDDLPPEYVLPDMSGKSLSDFDPWEQDSTSDIGNISSVSTESCQTSASLSQISNSSSSSTISTVSSCPILIPAGASISRKQKFVITDPRDEIGFGETIQVKISHIKNPLDFYVTCKRHEEKYNTLFEEIRNEADLYMVANNITINEIYLVDGNDDKTWGRALVTQRKSSVLVEVCFIDFGSLATVQTFRLKVLPSKFATIPPQALRCGLSDLYPSDETSKLNLKRSFFEMLASFDGKFIEMHVLGIEENKFKVDLSTNDPMCPISSVRDALLYLGEGSFQRNEFPSCTNKKGPFRGYQPSHNLSLHANVKVLISNVDLPTSFNIILLDDMKHLDALSQKINHHCNKSKSKTNFDKFCVGMPCLAKFEGTWYRGVIEEIQRSKSLLIRYVDFGNKSVLTRNDVRSIPDDLLKLPELSVHCSLTDIAPPKGKNWSEEARIFLNQYAESSSIVVTGVKGSSSRGSLHEVVLFAIFTQVSINVNALLVEQGLARSTGTRSSVSMDDTNMKKAELILGIKENEDLSQCINLKDTAQENCNLDKQSNPLVIVDINSLVGICQNGKTPMSSNQKTSEAGVTTSIRESSDSDESQFVPIERSSTLVNVDHNSERNSDIQEITPEVGINSGCHNKEDEKPGKSVQTRLKVSNNSDGSYRIPVDLLSAESPGCVFVRLKSIAEKIERMSAEMQLYYDCEPLPEGDCWIPKERDRCAVKSPHDLQWHRGLILEVLSGSQFKVMLKDTGRTEVANIKSMRKLYPKFATVPDGSIKCHLANLRAAGSHPTDGESEPNWTAFACTTLVDLLNEHKRNLYISKQGQINKEERSLPIEVWVRELVGTALQASKITWFTINKKLIEKGCALPIDWKLLSEEDTQLTSSDLEILNPPDDPDLTMMEWLEKTSQDSSGSSAEDWDEVDETLTLLGNWLPPLPLPENSFLALPTYVDFDCNVYLHEVSDSSNGSVRNLRKITRRLHKKYRGSKPGPEDSFWLPNNLCVVQYHLDKKWYRGKVMKVNPDNRIEVQFADYGNVEVCRSLELRKNIICKALPSIARKCRISGVTPTSEDGKWPISTLDFIHGTLVDNECTVKVLRKPTSDDNVYEVDIFVHEQSITEILSEKKFATFTPVNYIIAPEALSEEDDDPDVLVLEEPAVIEDDRCCVSKAPSIGRGGKLSRSDCQSDAEPSLSLQYSPYTPSSDGSIPLSEVQNGNLIKTTIGRGKKLSNSGGQTQADLSSSLQFPPFTPSSDGEVQIETLNKTSIGRRKNLLDSVLYQTQSDPGSILQFSPYTPSSDSLAPLKEIQSENMIHKTSIGRGKKLLISENVSVAEPSATPQFLTDTPSCYGFNPLSEFKRENLVKTSTAHSQSIKPASEASAVSHVSNGCVNSNVNFLLQPNENEVIVNSYTSSVLPKSNRWDVTVLSVLGPTEIVVLIKNVPEESEQWNFVKDYERMFIEMQAKAALQPHMPKITPGFPCCVLSCDGLWYRGRVKEINKTTITIEKVDSGEEECVPAFHVRAIPNKWLQPPILGVECKLNCDLVPDKDVQMIAQKMLALLINKNVKAAVVKKTPLTIDLFCNEDKGQLIYQELIDEGLIAKS